MNEYADVTTRQGDDAHVINEVLAGFVPLGDDNPVAQETRDAVENMLRQRAVEVAPPELTPLIGNTDSGMIIRPGDVLVVSMKQATTQAQAEYTKDRLKEAMPGLADVIVMTGVHVEGVYRKEEE